MEKIDEETLREAEAGPTTKKEEIIEVIDDNTFQDLLEKMQDPVQAQKELAVRIKVFLDKRIESELADKGYLTDHTRRWVKQFNELLDSIQKALYGDRSVNLHVHKVTHSHVAAKIREVQVVEVSKKKKKAVA